MRILLDALMISSTRRLVAWHGFTSVRICPDEFVDLAFNLNIKSGFPISKHPNKNIGIRFQYQYPIILVLRPIQCQASQCLHPNKTLGTIYVNTYSKEIVVW